MSYVQLPIVRAWLRVIGTADDVLIQRLIDQAEDEALRFLNRTMPPTLPLEYPSECQSCEGAMTRAEFVANTRAMADAIEAGLPPKPTEPGLIPIQSSEDIPSSDDPVAPSFEKAVCILVQAAYEQPDPDKAAKMRDNAFAVLWPYRAQIGV